MAADKQQSAHSLSDTELQAHVATDLPDREALSLIDTGSGMGMLGGGGVAPTDLGADPAGGTGTGADGSSTMLGGTTQEASSLQHKAVDTAQDAQSAPPSDGGTYSPNQTSTAQS